MSIAGKIAVVTGAAGAIGSAVSKSLVAEGAHVVLIDVASGPLALLSTELGSASTPVTLNLSDEAELKRVAASLVSKFKCVDILVNGAGILSNNKIAATTLEEWRHVNNVNVEAAFLLVQALLPGMRAAKWGRIINISSYAAKSGGLTAGTAYSVSKSALIGLTFSIARETAHEGVTANAIAPAYVMSSMISEQLTEEQRKRQLEIIPVGRFCEPEEVAHTVAFLASPLAGFITGEVIDMNGGLHFD